MKKLYRLKIILLLIIFINPFNNSAYADVPKWVSEVFTVFLDMLEGKTIEPQISDDNFNVSSHLLPIQDAGQWIPTGIKVSKNQLVQFQINASNIKVMPDKYLVLYRIDPRFTRSQVFIQQYDKSSGKYVWDYNTFRNGILPEYQNWTKMNFTQRMDDYVDYINFNGRSKIQVKSGDVINVTLIDANDYFGGKGVADELQSVMTLSHNLSIFHTPSSGLNNAIMYLPASSWCNGTKQPDVSTSGVGCTNTGVNNIFYISKERNIGTLYGNLSDSHFSSILGDIPSCTSNNSSNQTFCIHDKGRGIQVVLNEQVISAINDPFIYSSGLNSSFLYYIANGDGELDFITTWPIQGMFSGINQFMKNWNYDYRSSDDLLSKINDTSTNMLAPFVHFGRYFMHVEVGLGDAQSLNIQNLNDIGITLEYAITDIKPMHDSSQHVIDSNSSIDAYDEGYLWITLKRTDFGIDGPLIVDIATYTGSTWYSTFLYSNIISPIISHLTKLTKQFYSAFTTNQSLLNLVQGVLALYVLIYGLFFLIGSIKMTVSDLTIRVIKITFITLIFSPNSWDWFYQNIFLTFTDGMTYLMTSFVSGGGNSNVFQFIDPIINRYTNPNTWALLLIELVQFYNGLTFIALMTIYAILIYFLGLLEVIVSYCFSVIGLIVMMAISPFLMIFSLFNFTKGIAKNWLALSMYWMILPSGLLLFFLSLESLVFEHFKSVLLAAQGGCFIDLDIAVDLRAIGINENFNFPLPFLKCIPFFNSKFVGNLLGLVTSVFLFYIFCATSKKLVSYSTAVLSLIINSGLSSPSREGRRGPVNPIESMKSDMAMAARPIGAIATSPIKAFQRRRSTGSAYSTNLNASSGGSKNDYASNRITRGSRFDAD
ncbi:MAG: type IV secretion system protein [Rickettsiaceae bacterium]